MDQTPRHDQQIEDKLRVWAANGLVRWFRLTKPSIPRSMNQGLLEAKGKVVLFLDDDSAPDDALVRRHLDVYRVDQKIWAVSGKVIQPWDLAEEGAPTEDSCQDSERVMAGNLSVLREQAIKIGGFDENFVKVAYRFEAEFAHRLMSHGGKIFFSKDAQIRHLKEIAGGTRSYGDFRKTIMPYHSVGEYYYLFRSKDIGSAFTLSVNRFVRSTFRKCYVSQPWWILITLIAEFFGFLWAVTFCLKGPKYIETTSGVNNAS